MGQSAGSDPASRLESLLARALELHDAEDAAGLERLLQEQPQHADTLRAKLSRLGHLGFAGARAGGDATELAPTGTRPPTDSRGLAGAMLHERYRLDAQIGAGAMGVVYRADDTRLQRQVAVKVLPPELFSSADRRARFLREARALAALDHPHVVPIHDFGETEQGLAFLVMALLEGRPLDAVIERGLATHGTPTALERATAGLGELLGVQTREPRFSRNVARWVADLASGLAQAHEAGIVHRDIKPSNVMIRADGAAVLLDFGLARLGDDASVTGGGAVGTPCYMAPEQARGSDAMGPPTDVYGLTATLYHALTLQPPFRGTVEEIILRVLRDEPTPAHRLHPGLPRDLRAILDRGLERDPLRRYPSMLALEADLRAWLHGRSITARPRPMVVRWARRVQRRPARAAAVAASGLAVALACVAVPLGLEARAQDRAQDAAALRARLPLRLGIAGQPDERHTLQPEARNQWLDQLAQILVLEPDDVALRLLRAELLLDRAGPEDFDQAAREARRAARGAGSAYLAAVAERFTAADRSRHGAFAVEMTDLGVEPEGVDDVYYMGLRLLRERVDEASTWVDARAALQPASNHREARVLRLLATIGQAGRVLAAEGLEGAAPWWLAVVREAESLEAEEGVTARTRAAIGRANLALDRFADAVPPLTEAVELCPSSYGDWLNLGIAYRATGSIEAAVNHLEESARLRPNAWRAGFEQVVALILDRRHADALAATEALAAETQLPSWRESYLRGEIAMSEGAEGLEAGRPLPALKPLFSAALRHFRQARRESGHRIAGLKTRMARAYLRGDRHSLSDALLEQLKATPLDPFLLRELADQMPADGLPADAGENLRQVLDGQSFRLTTHSNSLEIR
ncbi:MAG: serine/threonine-protein kinase [Planctomycetota bacterium]